MFVLLGVKRLLWDRRPGAGEVATSTQPAASTRTKPVAPGDASAGEDDDDEEEEETRGAARRRVRREK